MNAVILVGGEGTRLRPLTCNTPKSMVPVLNKPFLEHVLELLKKNGVETVVLALGHLSQPVVDYFGNGEKMGVRLVYSVEKQPLGTAGPVKLAERYLKDTFLVLNGDVFADFDITSMIRFHKENRAIATLALTPVEDPSIYGVVETSPEGQVQRFVEKPKREEATSNMINAGLYVLEPPVLDYIPPDTKVMFEQSVFATLLAERQPMVAYRQQGYWIDIGTPQKYLQLNLDLVRRAGHSPGVRLPRPGAAISGPALVPDDCILEEGAQVIGPAVIGRACRIQRGSIVSRSVLWDRTALGPNSRVAGSVVANESSLGEGATVVDSAIGDHVVVSPGMAVGPGARVWPDTRREAA